MAISWPSFASPRSRVSTNESTILETIERGLASCRDRARSSAAWESVALRKIDRAGGRGDGRETCIRMRWGVRVNWCSSFLRHSAISRWGRRRRSGLGAGEGERREGEYLGSMGRLGIALGASEVETV